VATLDYFQPTEIRFGRGRVGEIGELVAPIGGRCLIVSVEEDAVFGPLVDRVRAALADAGVETAHFGGVVPNPTTESVSRGAAIAQELGARVVLGVGGGSSIDTAKAIAVEATHPGTCWDYLYFRDTQPSEKTLPIVAVPTTAGTGSHVTQVAVVTNPESKTKSALFHNRLFPRACIVDPELALTVPAHVTASTGFDVFCHAFESWIHVNATRYTELVAPEALRIVIRSLPMVIADGRNLVAREEMAWADTLAGLCIANTGVTLPHGIAMTIGGHCPNVMHGEALAVVYPAFTRFTCPSALAKFASLGRIFNPGLTGASDSAVAGLACEEVDSLLKRIGMWLSLRGLGVSEAEVVAIADNSRVLPDYKNNPRLASREDILAMLLQCYERT
jgi:alcohol dehydrogenase class IV